LADFLFVLFMGLRTPEFNGASAPSIPRGGTNEKCPEINLKAFCFPKCFIQFYHQRHDEKKDRLDDWLLDETGSLTGRGGILSFFGLPPSLFLL